MNCIINLTISYFPLNTFDLKFILETLAKKLKELHLVGLKLHLYKALKGFGLHKLSSLTYSQTNDQ